VCCLHLQPPAQLNIASAHLRALQRVFVFFIMLVCSPLGTLYVWGAMAAPLQMQGRAYFVKRVCQHAFARRSQLVALAGASPCVVVSTGNNSLHQAPQECAGAPCLALLRYWLLECTTHTMFCLLSTKLALKLHGWNLGPWCGMLQCSSFCELLCPVPWALVGDTLSCAHGHGKSKTTTAPSCSACA
jgi:hypothetical protein